MEVVVDVSSLLKTVAVASHQYQGSETEADQRCLTKSIQELCDLLLTGEQRLKILSGDSQSPAGCSSQICEECIAALLALLRSKKLAGTAIHHGALMLLSLMAQNWQALAIMQRSSDTVRVLTQILTDGVHEPETTASKVLELLRLLTNNKKVIRDSYLQDLLLFLLKTIELNKDADILRSSLGVLANLCRYDRLGTQMQLRAVGCSKAFGKALVTILSHKDQNIVIFTLAVIANLGMEDELGKLLFHAKNLSQTMQLIFNVMVKGTSSELALLSCVDLMHDLLKHEHIQAFLASYENLTPFLLQLFKLFASCEPWMVHQMVQFLLTLTGAPTVRAAIGQVVIKQDVARNLLSTLLHIARQEHLLDLKGGRGCGSTMRLLRDLLEYVVPRDDDHSQATTPEADATLQCALTSIGESMSAHDICSERSAAVIEALLLLKSILLRPSVRRSAAVQGVAACASELLRRHSQAAASHRSTGRTAAAAALSTTIGDEACSGDLHVDVALYSLKLLAVLCSDCQDASHLLNQVLQDSLVVAMLAIGITSQSKDRVLLAVDVVASVGNRGVCLPLLSDLITTWNSQKISEGGCYEGVQQQQSLFLPTGKPVNTTSMSSSLTSAVGRKWHADTKDRSGGGSGSDPAADPCAVHSLATRMESGLEIKDLRTSEIMSVFEHKLRAAQTKEEHLQDLYDAKALALAQADRLIQQYRARMSQCEVEAEKLRSFLQDSEKRCEDGREQLAEMLLDRERLQAELERLHAERAALELQCAELARKLDSSQRALAALRQEHDTLREMHDALQKFSEGLKEQHRTLEKDYQQLEAGHAKTSQQLRDKEAKLADTLKLKQKQEELTSQLSKEKAELAQVVESLREKERQLNKKVASLGEACRNNESLIREKEEIIREQRCQLDKTGQMMSLINQIASTGRLPDQPQVSAK